MVKAIEILDLNFGGEPIEIVNVCRYIGIAFRNIGRFIIAIDFMKTQANNPSRYLNCKK